MADFDFFARAGSAFAARHAEAVFVTGHSPAALAPKVAKIRQLAAAEGRDPSSLKFFNTFTPIIGRTDEEAQAKLAHLQKYVSTIGGLVLVSGWTGIDLSKIPLGKVITAGDSLEEHKVTSSLSAFLATDGETSTPLTPELVAEKASIGGMGPVCVGSASTVADELERWVRDADVDGFNLGYVTTPGSFEDVVDLLVPELRRRDIYPELEEGLTAREKINGKGNSGLRSDHVGSTYKYDVYREDEPYVAEVNGVNGIEAEKKEK